MSWDVFRQRRDSVNAKLAAVFMTRPEGLHYGFDTMQQAGISSGALYPALARMEAAGWLTSGWEEPEPAGRRRRRWYTPTELGRREMTALLKEAG